MSQKWLIIICSLLLVLLSGCTSSTSKNISSDEDLRRAFEEYLTISNEAQFTYNTTQLSSVTTGQELENTVSFIEAYKKLEAEGKSKIRVAEEFKVEWVEVLTSGSSWAIIEAKKSYLAYSLDLETGEKSYDSHTRWRIQRFLMIKESDRWKVDRILEQVSWSG